MTGAHVILCRRLGSQARRDLYLRGYRSLAMKHQASKIRTAAGQAIGSSRFPQECQINYGVFDFSYRCRSDPGRVALCLHLHSTTGETVLHQASWNGAPPKYRAQAGRYLPSCSIQRNYSTGCFFFFLTEEIIS